MDIVRFNLWDYFKYGKALNISLKSLYSNYYFKVIYKNKVCMLWKVNYVSNLNAHIKNIIKIGQDREFILPEKVFSEFNIKKYIYETLDENEELALKKYGFEKRASNIMLKMNICDFNKDNKEKYEFIPFIKGKDEEVRCKIQNEIFYEENRIPLKPRDIVYECNRKAFLKDLAFFEMKDNNIIGYGQILLLKNKYTIANFGILEEFRGKGYGEALLIHILNQAKLRGLEEVYIKVKEDNIRALNLYKKVGFKEDSKINILELLG